MQYMKSEDNISNLQTENIRIINFRMISFRITY